MYDPISYTPKLLMDRLNMKKWVIGVFMAQPEETAMIQLSFIDLPGSLPAFTIPSYNTDIPRRPSPILSIPCVNLPILMSAIQQK
jgi:hypothetical protein